MTNNKVKELEKELAELRAKQKKLQTRKELEDKVSKLRGEVRALKLRKVINVGKAIKRAITATGKTLKIKRSGIKLSKKSRKKKRKLQAKRERATEALFKPRQPSALDLIRGS